MRLLLDTHAFLRCLADDPALPAAARDAIAAPATRAHVSAAIAWEITTEYRTGKLPVNVRHPQRAGAISGPHKDPFDRMLIAQSLDESLTLVSNESLFDGYGVTRLWL